MAVEVAKDSASASNTIARISGRRCRDIENLLAGIHARWNGPAAAAGRPLRIGVESPVPQTGMSAAAADQVLDVLIDNALRHGQGAITVTVRDAENTLAVDVSDEGPPLTADPRELFRRRSAADSNGIGLALARRLAESEGGRLVLSAQSPPRFSMLTPMPLASEHTSR